MADGIIESIDRERKAEAEAKRTAELRRLGLAEPAFEKTKKKKRRKTKKSK
jgi:hypothetical protein